MSQSSFDGSAIRNQVAYAFKNWSIVSAMPPQLQQQQHNQMGYNMGMQPMMYGGMGYMGGMGNMPMQGMNWGATNICMSESESWVRKPKRKKSKGKKTVDIDLSQDNNGSSSASVSDED